MNFSSEVIKDRRQQNNIFKLLKELSTQNSPSSRNVSFSFKNKGKMKTFSDEQKLTQFVTNIPTLKEWLKKGLYTRRRNDKRRNPGTPRRTIKE